MIAGGARFFVQLVPEALFQIRFGVEHDVIIVQECETPASGLVALRIVDGSQYMSTMMIPCWAHRIDTADLFEMVLALRSGGRFSHDSVLISGVAIGSPSDGPNSHHPGSHIAQRL